MTIPTKERISEIELRMTDERMDELLAMKHVPAEHIFEIMMALLAERDYVKALMEEREWQPIETAPKDETWIIIANATKSCPAYWGNTYFSSHPAWITYAHRSDWEGADIGNPTHWMPLPTPPKDNEE